VSAVSSPESVAPEQADDASVDEGPVLTPLTEPRDGVPPVITDAAGVLECAQALASGTGPVAVDAERASGYRYGQRAYLVQLRREGAGSFLIDPIGTGPLTAVSEALTGVEWILHAATQDLPCLAELDMRPTLLFDTELAGRLAGCPRVGLGPLVEAELGLSLEKGHGAADWSTRPLPEPWLRYAALDVEVLVELRDALAADLDRQGKLEWAKEEFASIVAAPPTPPRAEPWRRTSGLHRIRKPRQLAVVRALWEERDRIAQRRDIAPGRVLNDAAIVEAATSTVADIEALEDLPTFRGRGARRHISNWWRAIERGRACPADDLPTSTQAADGPPPPRAWADRDPAAAARLSAARAALSTQAESVNLPVENLLTPDLLRRICWQPPDTLDDDAVAARLREGRAREWQIALTLPLIVEALHAEPSAPTEPVADDEA
jgi:ribonuclease D